MQVDILPAELPGKPCLSIALKQLGFVVALMVKHLPAVLETQVQSSGWEDPVVKEVATHSSILGQETLDRGAW